MSKPPDRPFNADGRQSWKYKEEAKKYHADHNYQPFTMTWNKTIEAEMKDKSLTKESRVLAAIRRYAWGNLSDFAVDAMPAKSPTDPRPRPFTQERLGEILNIKKGSMSEACRFLKQQGYLRSDHPFLFPILEVSPLDSEPNVELGSYSANPDSLYLRLKTFVFEQKPEIATMIEQVTDKRKRLQKEVNAATKVINDVNRQILGLYRDLEREFGVEELAKSDFNHIMESSSNSKLNSFVTPSVSKVEHEPDSAKKPNESTPPATEPLKSLKLEIKIKAGGGDPLPNAAAAPPPPLKPNSSPDYENLVSLCAHCGLADEAGITRLIANCRATRPDATLGEIAHFVEVLATKKQKQGDRKPLAGVLIKSTADYFKGNSFEQFRSRQTAAEPRTPQEAETAEQIQADIEEIDRRAAEIDAEYQARARSEYAAAKTDAQRIALRVRYSDVPNIEGQPESEVA